MVVASPISNDLIQIPDKNDPTKMIKTTKLLLQCSVREIHNDLIKVDWLKDSNGEVLVSDWKLRQIMPPEIRRMANKYKEMCSCITVLTMK